MILYYSGTGNSWMIANRGEWMGEIPYHEYRIYGVYESIFCVELVMDALGIVNVFLRICAERKAGSL